VFDTECVRQGNCSTISGVVRLGFDNFRVGQLPASPLLLSDSFCRRDISDSKFGAAERNVGGARHKVPYTG